MKFLTTLLQILCFGDFYLVYWFFFLSTISRGAAVAPSVIMTPRIQQLTRKKMMLAAQSPGTKVL